MKLATIDNRLSIVTDRGAIDVESASQGTFSSDPQSIYGRWSEFNDWAAANSEAIASAEAAQFAPEAVGAPVPAPRQIFGIGLNYRDHAAEANMALPEGDPVVFAKYTSSITGPVAEVELPSDAVDFETELVVVIGARAHRVASADAWEHVAGFTLGQDISERNVQFRTATPQFSLGKSYPGFSPIGPVVATLDEFSDRDDIALGCTLNGQQMQDGKTSDFVFTIPELIESLSAILPLQPGDLIFTGTPAGIGWARDPKIALRPGDSLVSRAEVIGEMTTTFVARS